MRDSRQKILNWDDAAAQVQKRQDQGIKVVFTNGCFDLLHVGHLRYLTEARKLGGFLVVGLNSDRSIREIKGQGRPVNPEDHRAEVLAGLEVVDAVVIFDQPDPQELISRLQPDVLVKGGDWPVDRIVGRETVWDRGGLVTTIALTPGVSTTEIIRRLKSVRLDD